jgi:hypothetical protein
MVDPGLFLNWFYEHDSLLRNHGGKTVSMDQEDKVVRFVIYGAGTIGGTIGARPHRSGCEVLLVARGAHLDPF